MITNEITECILCRRHTSDFLRHYHEIHELLGAKIVFACGLCATSIPSEMDIEAHLTVAHDIDDCKGCSAALVNKKRHYCETNQSENAHRSESYCFMCRAFIQEMKREDFRKHMKLHMPLNVSRGFIMCQVCKTITPEYSREMFIKHSCAEMNRTRVGDYKMICGNCKRYACDSIAQMEQHWRDVHWYGARHYSQKEIDFEVAKNDPKMFVCNSCRGVFSNGFDHETHKCGDLMGKQGVRSVPPLWSDVAARIANIGKPEKPVCKIVCAICNSQFSGEKFEDADQSYQKHPCRERGHTKRRFGIMVSPGRQDKTFFQEVGKRYAGPVIVYHRGMTEEEDVLKLFREAGATVLQIGGNSGPMVRDMQMLQQCDLVFFFPSKKDSPKGSDFVLRTLTVKGAKVEAIICPDTAYLPSETRKEDVVSK